mmetsp:Transcript_9453/g.11042  ORF Transcript_9453/g.11042 Transcript_9453/m.11042 type:complete len:139 (-) Transcript_9453:786-1202(-)
MSITTRSLHFKHPIVNTKQCHIKRPATQIKHQDCFFPILFIKSIRNSRGGRFINHPFHGQTRNRSCVFRRLTLGIIEIRRYGHHRACYLLPEEGFRRFFETAEDHTGYFLGTKDSRGIRTRSGKGLDLNIGFAPSVIH